MIMAERAGLLGLQQYVLEPESSSSSEAWLLGGTPGPAGATSLVLTGVEVALDAADPSAVAWVRVDGSALHPRSTGRPLVERLLGAGVLAELDAVLDRPRAQPVRLGRGRGSDPSTITDQAMVRLVVASASSRLPGWRADERDLVALESAVTASALGLAPWFLDWPDVVHTAARSLIDRGVPDDAVLRRHLAQLATDTAAAIAEDVMRARLLRFAAELRAPDDDAASDADAVLSRKRVEFTPAAGAARPAAVAMPAAAPMAESAAVRPLPRPVDTTPDSLVHTAAIQAAAPPTIVHTSGDEHEVRLRGWGGRVDGWWLRVFRGSERAPRAVVPVVDGPRDATARFLVAADDLPALVIDIVDDPTSPRSSEAIASFRAALATGRRAAQLERLGRPSTPAWQRCADMHGRAGDEWRAKTAGAFATGNDRTRRLVVPPVVADLLAR
jgi:hypothetical protein